MRSLIQPGAALLAVGLMAGCGDGSGPTGENAPAPTPEWAMTVNRSVSVTPLDYIFVSPCNGEDIHVTGTLSARELMLGTGDGVHLVLQVVTSETGIGLTTGATYRSQPGAAPARAQAIVRYPGTTDWWTLEPDQIAKPSGNLNAGSRPTYMQRIEARMTLRTDAADIEVFPLDERGMRKSALDIRFIERVDGGFRIHLQADGQEFAPWYEISRSR